MSPEVQGMVTPWMIKFAFWASLILTAMKIIELANRAVRRPSLDLRLTREVFFRLIDVGEVLFCNVILMARNGPLLISEVNATLKKTDKAEKVFPLTVLAFGEKIRGSSNLSDHYFYTTSPLAHIPASVPQRTVYLCAQQQYKDRIQQAIASFRKEVLDYKTEFTKTVTTSGQKKDEAELFREINGIIDSNLGTMMDLVQLEPGSYKLTVTAAYRKPGGLLDVEKQAHSTITFRIHADVRDLMRSSLRQTLYVSATNLIFDQTQAIIYPEYLPLEVVEVDR